MGPTSDSALVGFHTITVQATLADFPEMDGVMMVSSTFQVEIKSDCFLTKMIKPSPSLTTVYHMIYSDLV